MTSRRHDATASQEVVPAQVPQPPAHHRPPAVEYRDGIPYHYTVGQQPTPHIVVQMPERPGMDPRLVAFAQWVVIWLVVAVVLTGCVCAVVVMVGGTLMGIIGAIGANAVPIGILSIGSLLAAGSLAAKMRGGSGRKGGKR